MTSAFLIFYFQPVKFCSTNKKHSAKQVPYRSYSQIIWDKLGAH